MKPYYLVTGVGFVITALALGILVFPTFFYRFLPPSMRKRMEKEDAERKREQSLSPYSYIKLFMIQGGISSFPSLAGAQLNHLIQMVHPGLRVVYSEEGNISHASESKLVVQMHFNNNQIRPVSIGGDYRVWRIKISDGSTFYAACGNLIAGPLELPSGWEFIPTPGMGYDHTPPMDSMKITVKDGDRTIEVMAEGNNPNLFPTGAEATKDGTIHLYFKRDRKA